LLAAAKIAGLPADKEVGPRRVRPRDLRSSFATLLIYEGQPPQYVAEQLGHSPATLLRDYARVWQEFDPAKRVSAEEQIERVRSRLRRNGVLGEREGGQSRRASRPFHAETRVPLVFHDDRALSSRGSRNPSKSN
jgi:Phage integrase family